MRLGTAGAFSSQAEAGLYTQYPIVLAHDMQFPTAPYWFGVPSALCRDGSRAYTREVSNVLLSPPR